MPWTPQYDPNSGSNNGFINTDTGEYSPVDPTAGGSLYNGSSYGGQNYNGTYRLNNGRPEGLNPATGQWEPLYSTGSGSPAINSAGNAMVYVDANGQPQVLNQGQSYAGSPQWALASQLQGAGVDPSSDTPINANLEHGDFMSNYGFLLPLLAAGGAAFLPELLGGAGAGLGGAAADASEAAITGDLGITGGTGLTGGGAAAGLGGFGSLAGDASEAATTGNLGVTGGTGLVGGGSIPATGLSSLSSTGAAAPPLDASESAITGNLGITGGTGLTGGGAVGTAGAAGVGADASEAATTGDLGITGGTGVVGGGTVVGGGAAATGASALSKVLNGTATASDWATLAGQAAPGILGAIGANQQSSALSDLANQEWGAGAPSRARYEASMTPGFDPTSIPGYSAAVDDASNSQMRALSTQGNPYGNPGGLIEAQKKVVAGTELPALQNYQNQNATAGGFSTLAGNFNGTASQAIGSGSAALSSLGSAAGNVLNPQQTNSLGSLANWIKSLTANGSSNSSNSFQ